MQGTLGYRFDPTETTDTLGNTIDLVAKDYDVRVLLNKLSATASGDVDLSPYCTESHQGGLESCAGNATADSIEIVNAIEEEKLALQAGRAPHPPVQLSRLWIYAMARTIAGELGLDEGTYLRICFDVLSRFGICDEQIWPYDESKVFVSPSLMAQRQALGHKIHSYYRVKSEGQGRIDEVVAALRAKHPVVFGTIVGKAFPNQTSAGPVGIPSDELGGHAMIIVGFLNGLFKVKNSWGASWGDNGFWLMTPEYLTWGRTTDLWVPTLGTDFTS